MPQQGPRGPFGNTTQPGTASRHVRRRSGEVCVLTVLAHPEAGRVGERAELTALLHGRETALSRLEPDFAQPRSEVARPLEHPRLSRAPLRIKPGRGGGVVLDAAALAGRAPLAVGGELLHGEREVDAAALAKGVPLVLGRQVALLLHRSPSANAVDAKVSGPKIVGESTAILRVHKAIGKVADLPHVVLVRGETGTGKDLVAQALHARSGRSGDYVAVNVGRLSADLAASELFGAEKGAYTGAEKATTGCFGEAEGGTLLLDEIGKAPATVQNTLLRTLQEGKVRPVGAARARKIDVRVIAATDEDLDAAVAGNRFYAPLLYRLESYQISLPPLRERLEDLGRLFFHFLDREMAVIRKADPAAEMPAVPAEILARLASYHWPGNVRELGNVVRRLVLESRGQPKLDAERLEDLLKLPKPSPDTAPRTAERSGTRRRRSHWEVDGEELRAVLAETGRNYARAAKRLDVPRSTLYKLMESHGIRWPAQLGREEIEEAHARLGRLEDVARFFEVSLRGLQQRRKELGLC